MLECNSFRETGRDRETLRGGEERKEERKTHTEWANLYYTFIHLCQTTTADISHECTEHYNSNFNFFFNIKYDL